MIGRCKVDRMSGVAEVRRYNAIIEGDSFSVPSAFAEVRGYKCYNRRGILFQQFNRVHVNLNVHGDW